MTFPRAHRRPAAPGAAKKPRPAPRPFDAEAALTMARRILAAPPAQPHIVRPSAPEGQRIGAWVLPLEVCPRLNALAEMPNWARQKIKDRALGIMLQQSGLRRATAPLAGRPVVHAIRFSSVEPDRDSSWTKIGVDRLCVGRRTRPKGMPDALWAQMQRGAGPVGLGWLADDKPSALDLQGWWEPCPPKQGCVYIELWTGAPVAMAKGAAFLARAEEIERAVGTMPAGLLAGAPPRARMRKTG